MKTNSIFLISLLVCGCASTKISPERAPSSEIGNGKYTGVATVKGRIELRSGFGHKEIQSGLVQIELKGPNPFLNPVGAARGDQTLIVKAQGHVFNFDIPKELHADDGKISVGMGSSNQSANLKGSLERHLVRTYEEAGTQDCHYLGSCMTCNIGLDGKSDCAIKISPYCSGSQKAQFKVELFDEHLNLHIFNDQGSVDIKTSDKRATDRSVLKLLSKCS
jgi:hypothetical protein